MSIFLTFAGSNLTASSLEDNYRDPNDMLPITSSAVKSTTKSTSDNDHHFTNSSFEQVSLFLAFIAKPSMRQALEEYLEISIQYKDELLKLNKSRAEYHKNVSSEKAHKMLNIYKNKKAKDDCDRETINNAIYKYIVCIHPLNKNR